MNPRLSKVLAGLLTEAGFLMSRLNQKAASGQGDRHLSGRLKETLTTYERLGGNTSVPTIRAAREMVY